MTEQPHDTVEEPREYTNEEVRDHISFYSEDWATVVRRAGRAAKHMPAEKGGWEKWDFTDSSWGKIGTPKITWGGK